LTATNFYPILYAWKLKSNWRWTSKVS
jgi:hypothetical protein